MTMQNISGMCLFYYYHSFNYIFPFLLPSYSLSPCMPTHTHTLSLSHTHTRTHTHECVCVCVERYIDSIQKHF